MDIPRDGACVSRANIQHLCNSIYEHIWQYLNTYYSPLFDCILLSLWPCTRDRACVSRANIPHLCNSIHEHVWLYLNTYYSPHFVCIFLSLSLYDHVPGMVPVYLGPTYNPCNSIHEHIWQYLNTYYSPLFVCILLPLYYTRCLYI